ncbi:MAG: hypothetical protein J5871_00685 [Bacteroidales bacterium]|nr:hypothetical protein [Bacteroidales bacterium]
MIRYKSVLTIAAVAVLVVGCTDNTRISPSSIAREAQAVLERGAGTTLYTRFQTGTFECNDPEARLSLAQLKAAKLINYSVKRYAWWEKTRRWYNFAYDFRDHYIVTVSLTSKGERLVLDEVPAPVEKVDKDMDFAEFDASRYAWARKADAENWADIPNPFIAPDSGLDGADDGNGPDETASAQTRGNRAPKAVPSGTTLSDTLAFQSYYAALRDKEAQYVLLKLGKRKVVKVRNIQVLNVLASAKAEVILETADINDAGRILFKKENGFKELMNVSLAYYADKGWKVEDLSF